jgi:aconitate hydratase
MVFRLPLFNFCENIIFVTNCYRLQQDVTLTITRRNGSQQKVALLRIDTPIEVDDYRHGGILRFVLRELVGK